MPDVLVINFLDMCSEGYKMHMTVLRQFKLREKHIAWFCYFQPDFIMIGVMDPVSLLWSQTLVTFVGKGSRLKKQPFLLGGTVVI